MTDLYLGVITVAVVVIAATQVVFAIVAVRAATRAQALVERLQEDLKPLLAQLPTISADVARTSALVAAQAKRVDEVTGRLAGLVNEAATSLTQSVLTPLRDGMALVRGIMAAVGGARGTRHRARDAAAGHGTSEAPDEGDLV